MNNNEIKVLIGLYANISDNVSAAIAVLNSDLTANDKVQRLTEMLESDGNYLAVIGKNHIAMPNATHIVITAVTAGECEIKELELQKVPSFDFQYKPNPILDLSEIVCEKPIIFPTNESARNLRRKAERNKKKKFSIYASSYGRGN